MEHIKDQLSWQEFYSGSKNVKRPIEKISEFNRLITHSKNFFLISGYGAFSEGYTLIISKEFLPSFGLIQHDKLEELNFFIELIKIVNKEKYERNTVVFEHGMCACIGGLDRAHIHLMTVSKAADNTVFRKAIETVLYNRKAGINFINYKGFKLENIHDINQIFDTINIKDLNSLNNPDLKIDGKIYNIEEIQNLSPEKWPLVTINHINKGGHYVYFNSGFKNSSFLTTRNFQTQFGREVVFNIELNLNSDFRTEVNEIMRNNKFIEPWRWQNCMFEKKIISTMNKSRKNILDQEKNYKSEFKKFKIEVV